MLVRGGSAPGQTTTSINPKAITAKPWNNWNGAGVVDAKSAPPPNLQPIPNGLKKAPIVGAPIKPLKPAAAKRAKNNSTTVPATKLMPSVSSPVTSSVFAMGASPVAVPKPQTKITGFFKSQMRSPQPLANGGGTALLTHPSLALPPPLIKKDLTNLVIRSKEFPKLNQPTSKRVSNTTRKNSSERKPKSNGAGTKNTPLQGNTIKDIIMKKPINIAPRVDSLPRPQNVPIQSAEPVHSQIQGATTTNNNMPRIPQPPQLVLTAFRVTPEMLQTGQPLRLQGHGQTTTTVAGTNTAGMTITAAPTAENKGNPMQFQYPLNGSFVSFANLMAQSQQVVGTAQGMDGKQMQSQQQQIFLSQIGSLGKPQNAQFILNGTLVKLANQGTTLEACGSNRLISPAPANTVSITECGDLTPKSTPTLISTTSIPTMLTTTPQQNKTTATHGQQQTQSSTPMYMSMGQNGQFILNTTPMPPLVSTTNQVVGNVSGGIPQTMPSLQPISLSSFAEPSQHTSSNVLRPIAIGPAKRRLGPPPSSPPDLVLMQPIAKAMAAAAAGKKLAEAGNKPPVLPMEQQNAKPSLIPAQNIHKSFDLTSSSSSSNTVMKESGRQVVTANEQKIVSKMLTKTEVVQQTTTTLTTLVQTTTTLTTETVADQEKTEPMAIATGDAAMQLLLTVPLLLPTTTERAVNVVPPSLTSPKSLVLENLKMKSETTLGLNGNDRRLQISTNCLDVAKKQLGVLVDQQLQQECAKSPILSQPKTIRFPVRGGGELKGKGQRKSGGYINGNCYWEACKERFENSSKLLDHLQTHHVNGQSGPFKCLWEGCRVNGRESCSRRWLEGHVSSHGGSRTFKCIFEGCGQRFSSQVSTHGLLVKLGV